MKVVIKGKATSVIKNIGGFLIAFIIVGLMYLEDLSDIWEDIEDYYETSEEESRLTSQKQLDLEKSTRLYDSALLKISNQEYSKAVDELIYSLELNPNNHNAQIKLVELLLQKKKFNLALEKIYGCELEQCIELKNKIYVETEQFTLKEGLEIENFSILSTKLEDQFKDSGFPYVGLCGTVAVLGKLMNSEWTFSSLEEKNKFSNWIKNQNPEKENEISVSELSDVSYIDNSIRSQVESTLATTMANIKVVQAKDAGILSANKYSRSIKEQRFNSRDCSKLMVSQPIIISSSSTGNFFADQRIRQAKSKVNSQIRKTFRYHLLVNLYKDCNETGSCLADK